MDQCERPIPAANLRPCEAKCGFLLYKPVESSIYTGRLFPAVANEMCAENGAGGEVPEGNKGARVPKYEAKLPATVPKCRQAEKPAESGSAGDAVSKNRPALALLRAAVAERPAAFALVQEVPSGEAVSGDVPQQIPSAAVATSRSSTKSEAATEVPVEGAAAVGVLVQNGLADAPLGQAAVQEPLGGELTPGGLAENRLAGEALGSEAIRERVTCINLEEAEPSELATRVEAKGEVRVTNGAIEGMLPAIPSVNAQITGVPFDREVTTSIKGLMTSATVAGNQLTPELLAKNKGTAVFVVGPTLTDVATDSTPSQQSLAAIPKAVPLGIVPTTSTVPENKVPPETTVEVSADLPSAYSLEQAMASILMKVNELVDIPTDTTSVASEDWAEDELSTADDLSTTDDLSTVGELSTEDELTMEDELMFDGKVTETELADIPVDSSATAMEVCTAEGLTLDVDVTACSPPPPEELASEALTEICEVLVDGELVDIPTDVVVIELTTKNKDSEAKAFEASTTKGALTEDGLFVILDSVDGAVLSHGRFSDNKEIEFSPDCLAPMKDEKVRAVSVEGMTSRILEENSLTRPPPDVANIGRATEGEVTAALTNGDAEGEDTAALTNDDAEGEVRATLTNGDAEDEDTAVLTNDNAEGEDMAALTNDDAEGEVTAALTNDDAEGEVTATLTNGDAEGEVRATLTNGDAEDEDTAVLTNDDAEGDDTAALTNDDAEGEVTAVLTNGDAEGEVTAALTNDDAEGEVTAVLTNDGAERKLTMAINVFEKKYSEPLTLEVGNVCISDNNDEMCSNDNGCQDIDLNNCALEYVSVPFPQTLYREQEASCVQRKDGETVKDRADVFGEFGTSPVWKEAAICCVKLRALQSARRRRRREELAGLIHWTRQFPSPGRLWVNRSSQRVGCWSREREHVISDMDHKVQPLEGVKPKTRPVIQVNDLAGGEWCGKPVLLEHLSTIANGLSAFSKTVKTPQEFSPTSDLILALGMCSRSELLEFCFDAEPTCCPNTFCHLSSQSKEQSVHEKPPTRSHSGHQHWPFPGRHLTTPGVPISPRPSLTPLLSSFAGGDGAVNPHPGVPVVPPGPGQDSWAVSRYPAGSGQTRWLPASPPRAGRCPCTRPRFGLHTILALSSPACYRLYTRQRHFGRVANARRPLLAQFGEDLKRLVLPFRSDGSSWWLTCALGRVVSWRDPSHSVARFNIIRPPNNCTRSDPSFHPSNLIAANGTNLSEAKSLLILQANKRIDLQHLNFDCLKEPYLALPEPPTSAPECTVTADTFSSASALVPSIAYVETQRHAEQKEEPAAEDKPVSKSKASLRKVSQIRIRRSVPKQDTNLTPMGLPKAKRLKKKEFSLEEIYTNQNYKSPSAHSKYLETIFEEPVLKKGALICTSLQKRKRLLEFQDYTLPRKRRAHAGVKVQSRTRARKATTREGEIDSLLVQKLNALEAFLAGED